MEFIGDIERLVATNLYPLRGPIAIGLAIATALLLIIAGRRRWDLVIRRNPRRSLAVAIPALIVGVPLAWYLGSPLFITTQLVEEPAVGGSVVSTGTFQGADEFHFGRGRASVVASGDGTLRVRFDNFSVRNGPDLFVYVVPGKDADVTNGLELGALKATEGSFEYVLPAGTDPSTIGSVIVWCKQFAVLFASASIGDAG
ncbi:MAG: DM13 domain-containing protein [Chloroflexota bacterium]